MVFGRWLRESLHSVRENPILPNRSLSITVYIILRFSVDYRPGILGSIRITISQAAFQFDSVHRSRIGEAETDKSMASNSISSAAVFVRPIHARSASTHSPLGLSLFGCSPSAAVTIRTLPPTLADWPTDRPPAPAVVCAATARAPTGWKHALLCSKKRVRRMQSLVYCYCHSRAAVQRY